MLAFDPSAVAVLEPVAPLAEAPVAWKHIVAPVEPFLQATAERLSDQISAFEKDIAAYAAYALTGQGKQLRPALVALSGSAAGQVNDSHVLVAVIIEMVHLATLVHDDVMDESSLRRGRPTLAAQWGSEISVLLGDCLFAHALKLAASFPTTEICRAVAAATNTVCSGEILQTQLRKNFTMSRAEYFKVLQMKTGELFALSCDLGAYLSGAGAAPRSALRHYGMGLGTAYQVFDDLLDLFGTESAAGKSLGTDLAKGKLTLPLLLALERATSEERARMERWVAHWEPGFLPPLLELLEAHGALEGSRRSVHQHLQAAQQSLAILPESEGRTGLAALTGYLGRQTDALGVLR